MTRGRETKLLRVQRRKPLFEPFRFVQISGDPMAHYSTSAAIPAFDRWSSPRCPIAFKSRNMP
jgi:hypothetical protein